MRLFACKLQLAVQCMLLSACVSHGTSGGMAPSEPPPLIGWLHGPCIALPANDVSAGSALVLVTLADPQEVVSARVTRQARSVDNCPALNEDRRAMNLDSGATFYLVEPMDSAALAVGVLSRVPQEAQGAVPDIDGDGRGDAFGYCTTAEGVRFSARAAATGAELWSGYYYLGYDTQPDCPPDN